MKIVFVSYYYTPSYSDPQLWTDRIKLYACILEKLALLHQVISIEQINYEGVWERNGVSFHFKKLTAWERRLPLGLHQYIKGLQPDVVLVHGLHFSKEIILLRLQLGGSVKIIAQHHAEQPHTGIKKYLQRVAGKCCDACLFASVEMGREWVERGNLASLQKIHEVMEVSSVFQPIDKALAQAHTGMSGSPVFLWVGRLNENKDPLNVVTSFLQFAQVNALARLYMVYQTEELLPLVMQLLASSAQGHAVKLIGQVAHPELVYWFSAADYILSGSYYEGSGTVVCEAMSCGVVPIVTDIPSFRMMTNNGAVGLLYKPGNQQQLLDALTKTTNPETAAKRTMVLDYYEKHLSPFAIAGKMDAIITGLHSIT